MNGTAAADLLEEYMKAAAAIRSASERVAHAGPNARDYHVKGAEAFTMAQNEHKNRIWKLREVLSEIEEIMQNIVEQEDQRQSIKRQAL